MVHRLFASHETDWICFLWALRKIMLFPRLILLYTIFVFTLSNPIQRDTSGNSKRQSLDENFPDELGLNDVSNPAQSLISDPSNDSLQSQDTVPTSPSAITAINNLNSPLIDSSSELLTNESIDDLNLAGLKCVSNESIDDSYDKSDIQKRSIISESPDSSCRVPVNVFNSPKKPPGPSTPSQPSSKKTPIPAIKHDPPTNGKPCGKSSLFPGSENYNIHLSCGGPKIGDFPSNPDVVLNCAPGRPNLSLEIRSLCSRLFG